VLRPAFAALAAAALLAGGIAIGVVVDDGGGGATTVTQAQRTLPLDPLDGGTTAHGRALVADRGAAQRVTLRLRGLPQSRPGEFYEVWLMDADGPLIAIGSFRVGADGQATVELPLPVPATDYQYFDISVQPEGDDANHSGESILRGATGA
jgi:anti-sigma-K factor RskA